jgi:hypothetical protein
MTEITEAQRIRGGKRNPEAAGQVVCNSRSSKDFLCYAKGLVIHTKYNASGAI